MISEQELEALSFPGAPKIVSAALPGPKSAALTKMETPQLCWGGINSLTVTEVS